LGTEPWIKQSLRLKRKGIVSPLFLPVRFSAHC
jgi:hypothetical protein